MGDVIQFSKSESTKNNYLLIFSIKTQVLINIDYQDYKIIGLKIDIIDNNNIIYKTEYFIDYIYNN